MHPLNPRTFPPLVFLLSLPILPVQTFCLMLGLGSLFYTHSLFDRSTHILARCSRVWKTMPVRTILERIIDDDKQTDKLWHTEMREGDP